MRAFTTAALLALGAAATAQEPADEPYAPRVEAASDEGREALRSFEVSAGFQVELWAAEPRLANPVCLDVDVSGDVYVGETFRHHAGVTDIREHMDWLDDDLAARSVEDRVAMFRKHLGEDFAGWETEHERVRLLRDTDGDGVADFDTIYRDGFDEAAAGIGAGLLSYRGDVYYTCIPSLWRLGDDDGDGRAERCEELSGGYGIRVALLGHDLHGLRIGPDGRLYFSIGDRGFSTVTKEGERIDHWHTGAVLRCELDGAGLEVYATGLRNPQELAFDDWGNLFTCDNNSDGGDRARVVDVLEGSDSGWRQAYQWITRPNLRGPWNQEKLWHPQWYGQAAYVLPPIANLADGPSGFTAYPGTGFGEEWRGRFLLADFRGTPHLSGLHAFSLEREGASFALGPVERFLWKVLVTDAEFGPKGDLFLTDWVAGWNKTGKGRVYRVAPEDAALRAEGARTGALLAAGMAARAEAELVLLLEHADRRVRQEAQFELAARGPEGLATLTEVARTSADARARAHAVWGIGMVARRGDPSAGELLLELTGDADARVRANVMRTLGDLGVAGATAPLVAALEDVEPRVRLQAAIALGHMASPAAVGPLIWLARENGGAEAALRHGAVFGLVGCAEPGRLVALVADPSSEVRRTAVVALRRLAHLGVVPFLADADASVALEAARAVYDVPIEGALSALAARIDDPSIHQTPLVRRVLAANWRLGGRERAEAVARIALRENLGQLLRQEAVRLLGRWAEGGGRDPVTGEWWPVERDEFERARAAEYVPELVRAIGAGIDDAPEKVQLEWLALALQHDAAAQAPRMRAWALDAQRSPRLRAECLRRLGEVQPDDLVATLRALLFDDEGEVRGAAVEVFGRVAPAEALPVVEAAIERGGTAELRAAYDTLAALASPATDARLAREFARLEADVLPGPVALELVRALERRSEDPTLAALLAARTARRAPAGELARWLDGLEGGDAERGRELFLEKSSLACLRCHVVEETADGPLGGRVGPDLRGVGGRLSRLELLDSMVRPNADIAEGFRSTLFLLDDDTLLEGLLEAETPDVVRVRNAEDELLELDPAAILERREGLSAMPEGLPQFLDRGEMRDLIEFLATL